MARFIDDNIAERPEQEELTLNSPDEGAEPVDLAQQIQQDSEEQSSDPGVPDKYQDKSVQELVQMHQEAEKLLGRQSSEVGELRKVVDTYIQTQLSEQQKAPESTPVEEEIDYFSDPEKAVNKAIENHPKIREAEELSQQYKKTNALATLSQKHPDMENILKDDGFAKWIKDSSIRTKLYVQADKQFDYEAADELFSLWKDRKQVVAQTVQNEKNTRKQALKTASTGSVSGRSEKPTRKIYRRQDIIDLLKNDPDRYMALSDEILTAYAEKRVK